MKSIGDLLKDPSFLDRVESELAKRPGSWSTQFAHSLLTDLRKNSGMSEGLGELFDVACSLQKSWPRHS